MFENNTYQSKFEQLYIEISDLILHKNKTGQSSSSKALTLLAEIRAYQEILEAQNTAYKSTDGKLLELTHALEMQIENAEFLRDQATTEVEIQKALLFQQSKMAAMGEMIGVIAHQLKQPITIQLLHVDMLQELHEEKATISEYAHITKIIRENILHMDETINVFSRFLAPSKIKMPFNACEAIKIVQNIMKAHLKLSKIIFEIEHHEDFYVNGYPNEFKHVLLNLVTNARDALLHREQEKSIISCCFSLSRDVATIYIRDNGGGIPDHLLPEELFQLHISSKGDKGSGIGLHISKKIIEEHMDGKLWVHNVEDGAEFVIELPLLQNNLI